MAKILRSVSERLSWGRFFGLFSLSCRKEMEEALAEAFRNKPF